MGNPIEDVLPPAAEVSRINPQKLPILQQSGEALMAPQGTLHPFQSSVREAWSQHVVRFKLNPLLSEIVDRLAKSCVNVDVLLE
jgi:hypothetical protein